MKDGTHCDSIPEAYMFLKYRKQNRNFIHHGHYGDKLKRKIYDFYFPNQNKYVEVTSFFRNYRRWKEYYANILKKKRYVENILGAKFEFIQFIPTKKQIEIVRQNSNK